MSEERSYQPGWGEKEHHHHHHHGPNERNRGFGGALRMKDKQAYYGLICIVVVVMGWGAYKLISSIARELRAMPNDDPALEMNVDELRIRKAEEQDALILADSLSQAYALDSMKHTVQIETRPVYRPPRTEDKWYITSREWKKILKNYRLWKRMREKEEDKD